MTEAVVIIQLLQLIYLYTKMQVAEGSRLRGASKIIGVDINSEKFIKGILFF